MILYILGDRLKMGKDTPFIMEGDDEADIEISPLVFKFVRTPTFVSEEFTTPVPIVVPFNTATPFTLKSSVVFISPPQSNVETGFGTKYPIVFASGSTMKSSPIFTLSLNLTSELYTVEFVPIVRPLPEDLFII